MKGIHPSRVRDAILDLERSRRVLAALYHENEWRKLQSENLRAKMRRLREKMRRKAYRHRLLADGDWPREWSPDDDERIARHVKIAESTHGLDRFTDRLKHSGMTFHAWYMHTAAELPLAGPKGRLP